MHCTCLYIHRNLCIPLSLWWRTAFLSHPSTCSLCTPPSLWWCTALVSYPSTYSVCPRPPFNGASTCSMCTLPSLWWCSWAQPQCLLHLPVLHAPLTSMTHIIVWLIKRYCAHFILGLMIRYLSAESNQLYSTLHLTATIHYFIICIIELHCDYHVLWWTASAYTPLSTPQPQCFEALPQCLIHLELCNYTTSLLQWYTSIGPKPIICTVMTLPSNWWCATSVSCPFERHCDHPTLTSVIHFVSVSLVTTPSWLQWCSAPAPTTLFCAVWTACLTSAPAAMSRTVTNLPS